MLVVIDDLDRISSDELLLTLKLIRQLGRLPYVHYLLSYDESTILDVLGQTSLIGDGGQSRARDYMEKVVQVRFDVPQLRPDDVLELVNQRLAEVGEVTGQSLSGDGLSRFTATYFRCLADRLTTPRAIRRYFAQARLLSSRLQDEVDLSDFLILTWLRTFEPGVYSLLQVRRSRLIGAPTVDGYARDAQERAKQRNDALEDWNGALSRAGTRDDDLANTLRAVAALFPRIAHVLDVTVGPSPAAPLRVANEEYFDRFFSTGISERDIADTTVRKAVHDMESGEGQRSVAVAKVKLAILGLRTLTVSKLVRASRDAAIVAPPMFAWLARVYGDDDEESVPLRSAYRVEELVADRLREMNSEEALNALKAIGDAHGGVLLANSVSRAMHGSPEQKHFTPTLEIQDLTTAAMRDVIVADHSTAATLSVHMQVAANSWQEVHPEGFRSWLLDEAAVRGDLVALSFFVTMSQTLGRSPKVHITRVDLEAASRYLDLAAIRRRHASKIAAARPFEVGTHPGVEDSPQHRMSAVLNALKAESVAEDS